MKRLLVEFTDGSTNEFLCSSQAEAETFVKGLLHVKGYEVKDA